MRDSTLRASGAIRDIQSDGKMPQKFSIVVSLELAQKEQHLLLQSDREWTRQKIFDLSCCHVAI